MNDDETRGYYRRQARAAAGAVSPPEPPPAVVHAAPVGDAGETPCCDRTPFELSPGDQMTTDRSLVTCGTAEPPAHRRTGPVPPDIRDVFAEAEALRVRVAELETALRDVAVKIEQYAEWWPAGACTCHECVDRLFAAFRHPLETLTPAAPE